MDKLPYILNLNGRIFDLSEPAVMGILNITPDSFFAGSRTTSDRQLLNKTEKHLEEGASMIDIGGYSTRPGAEVVSSEEEMKRIGFALETIRKKFPDVLISVDTFRSNIARFAVQQYSVSIINDISGGTLDQLMFETVAEVKAAYVLMHTRGNPTIMQSMTQYEHLISEVMAFLTRKIAQLRLFGVNDIIVDPGFGFAKTTEQNFELLRGLSYFKELDCPVLAGLSRKSMLYKYLDISPEEALNATTAVNMSALMGGANILRVHDVKEAVETVKLYMAIKNTGK